MPFLVMGVDSCHLNSPAFSTWPNQMWDQMLGKEKRFAWQFMRKKCFCVLAFELKEYFAFQLCVSGEEVRFSCKASAGEARDGCTKAPLCPVLTTVEAVT